MRSRRLIALLCAVAAFVPACTGAPDAVGTPSPSASAAPSPTPPSPSPSPRPARFDATLALAHLRVLAVTIGSREAGSPAYRRAASYVASMFDRWGYEVTRQRVPIPAGRSQGVPVSAGFTQNVIAAPPGYDPSAPHLVVGAHLDTVVPSPGGNDNGSGSAMLLELARLASVERTKMPVVWIAFGGEERRHPGTSGTTHGSRYYLGHLSAAERRATKGVMSIDMVGNGPIAYVCHEGLTDDAFVDAALAAAKRLKIRAQERIVVGVFSDHGPFERAGFTVAWLWSGAHPTLHTPRDTYAVAQRSTVDRIGRLAWETLRTVRL